MRLRSFILLVYSIALGMSVLCEFLVGLSLGDKSDLDLWGTFLSIGLILCVVVFG